MKTKQKAIILVVLIAIVAVGFLAYNFSAGGSLSVLSSGVCSVEPLTMQGHQIQSYDEFRTITGSTATDVQILEAGYVSCSGGLCGTVCTEALS